MYVKRQPAYIYPPLVALLYLPLAWLSSVPAGAVVTVGSGFSGFSVSGFSVSGFSVSGFSVSGVSVSPLWP